MPPPSPEGQKSILTFNARLQSTYQVIVDVLKHDGFQGLYNGLNSSLLGIAVTNGCASPNFSSILASC